MKIFIPAWHYRARALVQRTWGWSPIEEMVLLELDRSPSTILEVANELSIPVQVAGVTFERLMQFGLVELQTSPKKLFSTSASGHDLIRSSRPLPETTVDREIGVSLVYEQLGQSVCRRYDVTIVPTSDPSAVDRAVAFLADDVPENDVSMSERVYRFMAGQLRPGEWLRGCKAISSVVLQRYLVVDLDEVRKGLFPEGSSDALKHALLKTAETGRLPVLEPALRATPSVIQTTFDASQFILGAEEHLTTFERIIDRAKRDVFILSTFVAPQSYEARERMERVWQAIERACQRGVRCHLFLGTSTEIQENSSAMEELRARLTKGSQTRGFILVHRDTVHSHAKVLAADVDDFEAVAVVGSCNWLKSPYASVELSVELHEDGAVASVLDLLRSIVGSLSQAKRSVETLQFMSSELRRSKRSLSPQAKERLEPQDARITIIQAPEHERLLRRAAHDANTRFICCTNKMGAVMVPGLFNPAEVAGRRLADVRILYSRYGGPTKRRHVAAHRERLSGVVDVVGVRKPQLHCKFLAWDNDHVVVSSLNWGSQAGLAHKPLDEIGIYIEGSGLASALIQQFTTHIEAENL